jgi:hypothetical protein
MVETVKTLVLPALAWIAKGYWDRRSFRHVKGLKVFPRDGTVLISPDVADDHTRHHTPPTVAEAIHFCFCNLTLRKIYIHDAYLTKLADHITPHQDAAQDAGTGGYELKFRVADNQPFSLREVALETGRSAVTSLPLSGPIRPESKGWFGRIRQRLSMKPNNYLLCYTVTMDGHSYRVRSPR